MAGSGTSRAASILSPQEQAIFNLLSSSGQNRPFVQVDPVLTQVARARAADMARRHYFAHISPDGYGPNYMVRRAGYVLPDWWGTDAKANYVESCAAGRTTASETWSDWMASPHHKTHLLAEDKFYRDQTQVGVGMVTDPSSDYKVYWVVITAPPQPIPTIALTSPAANAQIASATVPVNGTTAGPKAPAQVLFRVENSGGTGAWSTASGTSVFTGTATGLQPGANVVRVRSVDAAGATMTEVARSVVYLVPATLSVAVNGAGKITAGFAGETQRYLNRPYTIVATPEAGMLFAGWSGGLTSKAPTLNFSMTEGLQLTANFIPNPFLDHRGTYLGLLSGSSAGRLRLNVAGTGAVSASLLVDGVNYVVRGVLGTDGTTTIRLPRRGAEPLVLQLALNFTDGTLSGTLLDGEKQSTIAAAQEFDTRSGRFAKSGQYTVVLPPEEGSADATLPQGVGYGSLVITPTGLARLSGVLPNGRSFVAAAMVTEDDSMKLYVPLGGTASYLAGTVRLWETAVSDLQGSVHWKQATTPRALVHPEAIETTLPLVGSRYVAPQRGTPVVPVAARDLNSQLVLEEGNLEAPVTQPTTLETDNRIVVQTPVLPGLRAAVNPANGIFGGSFVHPVTRKLSRFSGVIFQKQAGGWGFFLGASESGTAQIVPAP